MKRVFLLSGRKCSACRVVERMLKDIRSDIGLPLKNIDVETMDYAFAFRLLSQSIYIGKVPTMILEIDGEYEVLFTGVPDIDDLREMLRGDIA